MARRRKRRPMSEETKRKISKALTGCHNPNYGKRLSETQKRNLSLKMTEIWVHRH